MATDTEYTKNRFIDLSRMSYERGTYTFTDFLTLAEQSDLHECIKQLYCPFEVYGGYKGAERTMVRFGSASELGYEVDYPISCIRISPLQKKFAENLSHRDYLGSLMNLGIERPKLGDIIIKDENAYVWADETLAPVICSELTRIRHTSVMSTIISDVGEIPQIELTESVVQVKSERIDAVIAKAYNLSRSQSAELFLQKKIFTDGRLMENESHTLKPGTIVSVRGYGRFIYDGVTGTSKKGSLYVTIRKFSS